MENNAKLFNNGERESRDSLIKDSACVGAISQCACHRQWESTNNAQTSQGDKQLKNPKTTTAKQKTKVKRKINTNNNNKKCR